MNLLWRECNSCSVNVNKWLVDIISLLKTTSDCVLISIHTHTRTHTNRFSLRMCDNRNLKNHNCTGHLCVLRKVFAQERFMFANVADALFQCSDYSVPTAWIDAEDM